MKKKLLLCAVAFVFLTAGAGIAQADLTVYYDQASFLANAGSTALYDFESDSAGYISPPSYSGGYSNAVQDFGDFSIDSTSSGIYSSQIRDLSGNKDILVDIYNNSASLKVIFDHAVTAFGFTFIAEGNNSWDHSTFSLNGTTWDLGTPGDAGFFGIVETTGTFAAGTGFSFGQQSSNWSAVSFDNLRYSSISSVPLPGAIWLAGSAIAGFAGVGRFRTKERNIGKPTI
jgi:hypothetical protein